MTIKLEPTAARFSSVAPALTGKELASAHFANGHVVAPPLNRPLTKSDTVLLNFIESYKELQSYRQVLVFFASFSRVANQLL
jgi:hypothetical protein